MFMFSANWRLTVMTLILVPLNLQICAVYGQFYKRLVKEMQTKLAHANVIADEVSLITCSAASLFGRPLSDTDWQCASLSRLLRAACSGPNNSANALQAISTMTTVRAHAAEGAFMVRASTC